MTRRVPVRSALLGALLAVSCAQQQPPIVRVQPDALDKSFFVGKDSQSLADDPEFYSQATLVDVGYGAGQDGLFTSTYAQPLTRVKWTVTEDLLIARLAYERIRGSDGKGLGKATNDGIVVAAYAIKSHFDIKRDYNPQTGEQTNVIGENTVDRPWHQRQYIRVDWSKNLSTDNYEFDTLSQLGVHGGITYEPLAYTVQSPGDDDAPRVDAEHGYLDVTNKAFARPQLVDLAALGGGVRPACFFDADISGGSAPTTQCSPVELTIRQSFRKVEDSDYEPADWDGDRFKAFGAFTTERSGYAREYGMTDTQWHRFINRYNLWERSHFYQDANAKTGAVACFTPKSTPAGADPHRDVNKDGTEDECDAVGRGSRCDTFSQKCTLPYRDRTVKPVVWFFSDGSNPEYFDATRDATHEWDVALRTSVMTARYAECVKTKGAGCDAEFPVMTGQQDDNDDAIALAKEVDDCRAGLAYVGADCNAVADSIAAARGYTAGVIALAKLPEAIVLCHSPVEANDPAACGTQRLATNLTAADCFEARRVADAELIKACDKGLRARTGDLRFHHVTTIVSPQTPSPWGIMVDAHDPLTGEKVSASINVWSHVTDLWSRGIVDTARYIRGELTTSDVTEGTSVRDWASAAEASATKGSLPILTSDQRFEMLGKLTKGKGLSKSELEAFEQTPMYQQAKQLQLAARDIRADALAPSSSKPLYEARRKRALNTPTEAALTTKMFQSYAGKAGLLSSDMMSELASPLRGANPTLQRDLRNQRELQLAERGACIMNEAPAPLAVANLATLLEEKFGRFDRGSSKGDQLVRAERMRAYVAGRAHYAVVTHEMGHSIGLRHNFVSSADALNYRPQYWQLRTDDGTATRPCTTLDATGNCTGPRYFDVITENEKSQLLTMFMQSSTMDYAGESTQDLLGLGSYDFAAARMFYGGVADVANGVNTGLGTAKGAGLLEKMDSFGGILGLQFSIGRPTPQDRNNTDTIHYSQLQRNYGLISSCKVVDPNAFKPATWDATTKGAWHPLLDGLIVKVKGQFTRCRQLPVDYVAWESLRPAGSGRAGPSLDAQNRVRFPYGFATDRWADLGNLSVYRHDNGADPYELFDFLITQQEVNHIFDSYRRGRQTFTVRGSVNRSLTRYNEKLRDAAKGLGLMANIYRDFAVAQGYDFESLWPYLGASTFSENLMASAMGFDHFARQLARPESGPHSLETVGGTQVLRSLSDAVGNGGTSAITVPNGATGYFGNVSFGGRPIENALATDKGEYNAEYTVNSGSYYEKAYTAMLMTESVDNFISDSRRDFLDARHRSVSMADVFPDGYRRWLGNNLTGDVALKGMRLATMAGKPMSDAAGYPAQGLGHISWTGTDVTTCFTNRDALSCQTTPPADTAVVDPQVGWEQQKFLIAYTLMYLPENEQQQWLNQMGLWELGADSDPGFQNRLELHLADGRTFIAKTFGTEEVLGKRVQKGVGARMLQYANELLERAYVTDAGPDKDGDGKPDWVVPRLVNGNVQVKFDPSIQTISVATGGLVMGRPGCDATDSSQCTCSSNKACLELARYQEVPFFMRQALRDYGLADPTMRGLH
jgi:hypothetical protein